jgi:hypothetical protein
MFPDSDKRDPLKPREGVSSRMPRLNACSSISRELARCDRPSGLDAIAFKNGQASKLPIHSRELARYVSEASR